MKPTPMEIQKAVERLAALRYFPGDEGGRAEVMRLVQRMVATKEQLDWLIGTMIDRVGEWRGTVEFRGLFCWRWPPADGIEASCLETPGFTADDSEAAYLAELEAKKKLEEPAREEKMLPAGDIIKKMKMLVEPKEDSDAL